MSGTPIRRTRLPSSSNPTHALSHSEHVAALEEVPAPQLDWVEPELGGEQIHLPLVAERDLHGAEAAHRTRRRVVRVGDARVDAHVRAAVRALRAGGRVQEDERRQQRVGAAVRDDADVLREQPPVGVARGAVAELHRVTLLAREQRLRAAPHHPHGAAGTLDDEREERLDRHVLLAAEAAAYVGRDHAHAVVGDAQDPREIAKMLDHLGRCADGDDAVGVEPGDPRLRLEVRVVDELRLVALLDDGVRGSQRGVDVALLELPARYQVALLVNERRALLERRLGVGHDRQLLVLDVDQLDGGERSVLGLGGNDRDRLAVVADDAVGEHVRASLQRPYLERLPWHVHPDGVLGHILGGQDGCDSGHRLRRGRVHPEQAGVRKVGPLEHRVQHPGEAEVGGVSGPARDLLDRVVPDESAPDDAYRPLADDAHGPTSGP